MRNFILFCLLFVALASQAQTYTFKAPYNMYYEVIYPNSTIYKEKNVVSHVSYATKGAQLTAFSFDKKNKQVWVSNNKAILKIILSNNDKDLMKALKKANLPAIKDEEFFDRSVAYRTIIDKYYNDIADSLIKIDRLNKAKEVIKAALVKRAKEISDSLKLEKRKQAVADSLAQLKAEETAEREMRAEVIKVFKSQAPIGLKFHSWGTDPDNYGQLYFDVDIINCSLKTIKYVRITGYVTNPVGDKLKELRTKGYYWSAKCVGPIYPRPTKLSEYDDRIDGMCKNYEIDKTPYFYNAELAEELHISSVWIQFMDKSSITLKGSYLQKHIIWASEDEE